MAKSKNNTVIDISYFLYYFGLKHEYFSGLIQHDTQEFCRLFLGDLNEELNENKNLTNYSEIIYTNIKSKINCNKELHDFFVRKGKFNYC